MKRKSTQNIELTVRRTSNNKQNQQKEVIIDDIDRLVHFMDSKYVVEDDKLEFREQQQQTVERFIKSKESKIKMVQLTGLPGTGKSSLIKTVLQKKKKFIVLEYNGNLFQKEEQFYQRMFDDLQVHKKIKTKEDKEMTLFAKLIQRVELLKRNCLLVVDEIDSLVKILSQDLIGILIKMNNFKVIGISNDHEIINKYFSNIADQIEPMKFEVYDNHQLTKIVQNRLKLYEQYLEEKEIKTEQEVITKDAIQYCVMKISSQHQSDIRQILATIQKTIVRKLQMTQECEIPLIQVQIKDIAREIGGSGSGIIESLSESQQQLLFAIYELIKIKVKNNKSINKVSYQEVLNKLQQNCRQWKIQDIPIFEFHQILNTCESYSLIKADKQTKGKQSKSKQKVNQQIEIIVSQEELASFFDFHPSFGQF